MTLLATIKNIGRTPEKINGQTVAPGATLEVDLDNAAVRRELRGDNDYVIVGVDDPNALGELLNASFTVDAQVGNARTVHVQLRDGDNEPLGGRRFFQWYIKNQADDTVYVEGGEYNLDSVGGGAEQYESGAINVTKTWQDGTAALTISHVGAETLRIGVIRHDGLLAADEFIAFT